MSLFAVSSDTTSTSALSDATSSGVRSSPSVAVMSAPWRQRNSHMVTWPELAAAWSGVHDGLTRPQLWAVGDGRRVAEGARDGR